MVMLLALFNPAQAATPIQFDSWNVNNGNIDVTAACLQAISCKPLVSENGFLQQIVDTVDGKFIHSIVTDFGVSGNPVDLEFQSETFIPFDARAKGFNNDRKWALDAKTVVRSMADGFENAFMMDADPYTDNNGNQLDIMNFNLAQTLNNSDMTSHFDYTKNQVFGFPDPINNSEAYMLDIDQDILLANGTTITGLPTTPDFVATQRYANSKRSGWAGDISTGELIYDPFSTAGSLTLPDDLSGTSTTSWSDGEAIETHWVAQIDNQGSFSTPLNYQAISTASGLFDDYTMQADTTTPIDPFDWDPAFGPAPASLQ